MSLRKISYDSQMLSKEDTERLLYYFCWYKHTNMLVYNIYTYEHIIFI